MIFVTGGTGQLGAHLLLDLARKGQQVRALFRKGTSTEWVEDLFRYWEPEQFRFLHGYINWVEGDLLETESLLAGMEGCTEVYHAAALVSFHASDREALQRINSEGTANMVNCALHMGIKRFCHVSSIAALGRSEDGQLIDEKSEWKDSPLNSAYSVSKYCAEREVWRGLEEGLPAVIVNPGLILGPARDFRSSAAIFRIVRKGMPFYPLGGNGFVDVRDVARAMTELGPGAIGKRIILVAENLSYRQVMDMIAVSFGVKGPRYRIGNSLLVMASGLFRLIDSIFGSRSSITAESVRNGSRRYYYDSSLAVEEQNLRLHPVNDIIGHSARYFSRLP